MVVAEEGHGASGMSAQACASARPFASEIAKARKVLEGLPPAMEVLRFPRRHRVSERLLLAQHRPAEGLVDQPTAAGDGKACESRACPSHGVCGVRECSGIFCGDRRSTGRRRLCIDDTEPAGDGGAHLAIADPTQGGGSLAKCVPRCVGHVSANRAEEGAAALQPSAGGVNEFEIGSGDRGLDPEKVLADDAHDGVGNALGRCHREVRSISGRELKHPCTFGPEKTIGC